MKFVLVEIDDERQLLGNFRDAFNFSQNLNIHLNFKDVMFYSGGYLTYFLQECNFMLHSWFCFSQFCILCFCRMESIR